MEPKNIAVFVEGREGKPKKPSLEALGEAGRIAAILGGEVTAVVVGPGARALAPLLAGASRVLVDEDACASGFIVEDAATAISGAVRASGSDLLLLAATAIGREVAGAVAADLGTCVAADVIEVDASRGSLAVKRPVYAGKAIASARILRLPAVITLRPNLFSPAEAGSPPATVEALPSAREASRARVVETIEPEQVKQDLSEADVIVSGGRGLKGPENFKLVEELASTLGGVVGASRAVCDAGWRPHSDQVGQTGKTVSPRLYVACGISGAIQHLAGMSSSKCIVAINKDANAPIFQVADYGLVGDVFEVIPALVAELKKGG